jgi:hypothetical protein
MKLQSAIKPRAIRCIGLLASLWFSSGALVSAQDAGEKAKIDALIHRVETTTDAQFIRNGSSYDSKAAAKFMRGKWHAREKDVHTVSDFIDQVATVSSTTGQPYLIRFKDGHQVKCADFLRSQLKK